MFAAMVAVGNAWILITALPETVDVQTGTLILATLTKAYVDGAVKTGVVNVAFPAASNTMVCGAPESTV